MADGESTAQAPLLERLGVRYFRSLEAGGPRDEPADPVHVLNPVERAQLRAVERGAIVRACLAGALSTFVSALADRAAQPILGANPDFANFRQNATYWGIVLGSTAIASVVEILYLYWDGLRSVHRLARAAGLDLFPEQGENNALAGAMARAALELPNSTAQLFGVDPWRESSRARLIVASLVYKAKVSVSNFVVKALVRRVLGRAVVRTWLSFVAIPVTAAWNGAVCFLILREARVRAMGPSAAKEMIASIFHGASLSARAKEVTLRSVACAIVRTEDLHPNLVALLRELVDRVGALDIEALDNPRRFLEEIAGLSPAEQSVVLRVLSVAAILDGRLTRAEERLILEAQAACKREPTAAHVRRLRAKFVSGDPISSETLNATAVTPAAEPDDLYSKAQ